MKNRILSILAALVMMLGLTNCTDENDNTLTAGRMNVYLTDAPFPTDEVAEANVTIFKIVARQVDGSHDENEKDYDGESDKNSDSDSDIDESSENDSKYIVLMEEEITVNLLELINGNTEMLASAEIPAGTYDQLRIFIKDVNIVMNDGSILDFKVPSGASSGLKIFIKPPIVVDGGLTADVLLDFDVSRSFVRKGNGGFNFKPVIKACNKTTAGTLMGLVSTLQEDETLLGLEGAQVAIYAADTLNTTTFTDETGGYMIQGLQAGSYDIEVSLEGYDTVMEEAVSIIEGNKTVKDFELVPTE